MLRALVCFAVLALARTAVAQEPTFPSHDVAIHVVVFASGRASVLEEFQLLRQPDRVHLEMRGDRCARVGPVSATLGSGGHTFRGAEISSERLRFEDTQRGPWTLLRASGFHAADSTTSVLDVRYDVELGEVDATLPLVLPSARLERVDGARGAQVALTVTFHEDLGGAEVLFPRLDRVAPSFTWHGRFLAIPSLLRLRLPWNGPARCMAETSAPTGGLEWRFWLFTGIMVVWVPLYLWIFGRRSREAA